jgi:hypothetical protein
MNVSFRKVDPHASILAAQSDMNRPAEPIHHPDAHADECVPDALYNEACQHFSENELVNLTTAIGAINTFKSAMHLLLQIPGIYQIALI